MFTTAQRRATQTPGSDEVEGLSQSDWFGGEEEQRSTQTNDMTWRREAKPRYVGWKRGKWIVKSKG